LDQLAFGIGFSGDGTRLWVRGETGTSKTAGISTVPVFGGSARRFLDAAFNVAWSPNGARIVYATGGNNGDSIFLEEPDGTGAKRIFATKSDEHSHYPVWSPDGRYIYFIYGGVRLAQADVWRVPSGGGKAEQITHHHGAVRYPALRQGFLPTTYADHFRRFIAKLLEQVWNSPLR
jgi:Tol biopolymer transport system component